MPPPTLSTPPPTPPAAAIDTRPRSSSSPFRPPLISRLSLHPQLSRLRARSVTSGDNPAHSHHDHSSLSKESTPELGMIVGSPIADADGEAFGAASPSANSRGEEGEQADDEADPKRAESWPGEKATRIGIRRGKSFTSLLIPPSSPSLLASSSGGLPQPPLHSLPEQTTPSPTEVEKEKLELDYDQLDLEAASPSLSSSTSPISILTFLPSLLLIVSLFIFSFIVLLLLLSTLPSLTIPHSISEIPLLTSSLTTYASTSFGAQLHLFGCLTFLFLWKQCFSIPGSVLTNVLFGALYGTTWGTIWSCLFTAGGSTGCWWIAGKCDRMVEHYFSTPLSLTRKALKLPPHPSSSTFSAPTPSSSSTEPPPDLFTHLLLARLFPLLPYSVLNIISGALHLPLIPFFTTLLLGSFPFNFSTCSVGSLISLSLSSSSPLITTLWSPSVVIKLVLVSLVSGIPVIFKDRLKALLSHGFGGGRGGDSNFFKVFVGWVKGLVGGRRRVLSNGLRSGGGGRPTGLGARRKWNKSMDLGRLNVLGRWEGDERDDGLEGLG